MPDPTPISTSAADLAASLAADMPPPTVPTPPKAAEGQTTAVPPQPAAVPDEMDSLGRKFDPIRYAADQAGRPKRDKLGRFFSKLLGKRGAEPPPPPPPSASFIPADDPPPQPGAPGTVPGGPDKYELAADVYTRGVIAAAMGVMGDEWEPDNEAEFRGLRDSVAAYLRAKGCEDLSPGWALALAGATYGLRRLPRPKTQARIAGIKAKLAAWWRSRHVTAAVSNLPHPGGAK